MQRQSVWGLVVFDWSRDAAAVCLCCSGVGRVLPAQQRPPGASDGPIRVAGQSVSASSSSSNGPTSWRRDSKAKRPSSKGRHYGHATVMPFCVQCPCGTVVKLPLKVLEPEGVVSVTWPVDCPPGTAEVPDATAVSGGILLVPTARPPCACSSELLPPMPPGAPPTPQLTLHGAPSTETTE
jgi:hypothetical protein